MPNIDVSDFGLVVAACPACSFVFQSSAYMPGYDEIMERAYAAFDVNRIFPFPERSPKNLDPLDILLRHLPEDRPLSVLEIGSNRGDLLYLLRERRPHYNVLGLEPTAFSDLAVPTIHAAFRPELFSCTFDVVVIKHVLEHLKDPRGCIGALKDLVREGGYLYVEVPDLDLSLDFLVEDFIPDHVNYFTYHTLSKLLSTGFSEVECERRTFLRILGRREQTGTERGSKHGDLNRLVHKFDVLKRSKREGMSAVDAHVVAGGKVIFYGASYYFARLFRELAGALTLENSAFIDDNLTVERETIFGLKRARAAELGDSDLVVICSNNYPRAHGLTIDRARM